MKRGFRGTTLLEVAFVTMIVGVAITALMEFLTSATKANANLATTPVALSIAQAGHEWARLQPYDDLCSHMVTPAPGGEMAYAPYVPPTLVSAQQEFGADIYANWAQSFVMKPVSAGNFNTSDYASVKPVMEITVTAIKAGEPVARVTKLYFPN